MNIANAKDKGKHKSSAQKSIWHCIMMLAPFEPVIPEDCSFREENIIDGEKDFYNFFLTLYRDMYENPEKYSIPTKPYDEYVQKANTNKEMHKAHYTDAKECKLRNSFQQAIQFYPELFYKLGLAADSFCEGKFTLVISKQKYNDILNSFGKTHVFKENGQRLNALIGVGIRIDEVEDNYYISSINYPKMFLGLSILCNAPDSKYKHMNYLRLDYKGYYAAVPEIDDIKLTMVEEHAKSVELILKSFEDIKLKYKVKPLRNITSGFNWKVEYALNGKSVFGFYIEPDYLMICIYFNNAKNITEFSKKLENNNAELFNWLYDKFTERLCKCPNNRVVFFGEVKKRICGLSNRAEIVNPSEDDVKSSIRVIKMFRNMFN